MLYKKIYKTFPIISNKEYPVNEVANYLAILFDKGEKLLVNNENDCHSYAYDLKFALEVVGSYMSTVGDEYMPKSFKFRLHQQSSSVKLSIDCIWCNVNESVFQIRRIGNKLKDISKLGE